MTVKSAQRVLEIFEYFADRREAATADEIRRALRYPQSSASMLLRSLAEAGYLAYDRGTRTFYPTIRVALLGGWIVDKVGQRRSAPAIMRRLSKATGETIVLGCQQGIDVVYVQVIQATNAVRFYMRLGARRPLCLTAIGRALLSSKSDTEIGAIVRRINAERVDGPALSPSKIIESVREGRRLGYFCTKGAATPGAGVIAVSIPTGDEQLPLSIGIGAPVERINRDQNHFVKLLRAEIKKLSRGIQI